MPCMGQKGVLAFCSFTQNDVPWPLLLPCITKPSSMWVNAITKSSTETWPCCQLGWWLLSARASPRMRKSPTANKRHFRTIPAVQVYVCELAQYLYFVKNTKSTHFTKETEPGLGSFYVAKCCLSESPETDGNSSSGLAWLSHTGSTARSTQRPY